MGRELSEIPSGRVREDTVERGDQGAQVVEGQSADREPRGGNAIRAERVPHDLEVFPGVKIGIALVLQVGHVRDDDGELFVRGGDVVAGIVQHDIEVRVGIGRVVDLAEQRRRLDDLLLDLDRMDLDTVQQHAPEVVPVP